MPHHKRRQGLQPVHEKNLQQQLQISHPKHWPQLANQRRPEPHRIRLSRPQTYEQTVRQIPQLQ